MLMLMLLTLWEAKRGRAVAEENKGEICLLLSRWTASADKSLLNDIKAVDSYMQTGMATRGIGIYKGVSQQK